MTKENKQDRSWKRRGPDNIYANGELTIESPTYGVFIIQYDLEDEEKLKEHKWHIWKNNGQIHKDTFYARAIIPHPEGGIRYRTCKKTGKQINDGKRQFKMYMHRYIMNAKKGNIVDHKNGDTLNNKKDNLRFCTASQNTVNSRYSKNMGSSVYRGVSYKKKGKHMVNERSRPWLAQITYQSKCHPLGYFATEEEAARARDKKALELHGEFARLNFPNEKNTEKNS